ncbi:tagatose 1,6-diphosphate aldolase [Chloroflexota bacterium]
MKGQSYEIGKIRGLQQLANRDGMLTICAIDHRGSLRRMINMEHPEAVPAKEMTKRKLELCSTLAEHASAVLFDPVFGAAQCISHNVLPHNSAFLISIEASGYGDNPEERITEILKGWSVEKIKRMGASAVKILVYYRPDLKKLAEKQLETINGLALECKKYDIPFLVEPKSYPVGSEVKDPREFATRREQLVIDTARDITALPIDVLKAEFPADLHFNKDKAKLSELCRQLDEASRVPWVILSSGVDYDMFCEQAEIASQAGASGFLGGRAIWQEAVNIDNTEERVHHLATVGVERLKYLTGIANKYATPWYQKMGLVAENLVEIPENWYKEY